MPVCPQCDNRPFANKEALLQHMKTSSAWHPVCLTCDRRFSSQDAYNAHMNDKHPPTFDCLMCNRQFAAPYALEDHYRGSQLHPNCVRCGRGFKDAPACDEHYRTVHPKVPCASCGGMLLYADSLEQHYKDSGNHPSCEPCNRGFKDLSTYNEHFPIAHPERHCVVCQNFFETPEALQTHLWSSPNHPKCDRCNLGFADGESHDSHLESVHASAAAPYSSNSIEVERPVSDPDVNPAQMEAALNLPLATQNTIAATDINVYNTGFTPLSPRDRMQALIVGERRRASPDLRLDFPYSSPLTEVKPLFSPTIPSPLPRPGDGIERIWTSRENITTSRLPLTPSPRLQPSLQSSTTAEPQTYRHSDPGPSKISIPSWYEPTQPVFQPRQTVGEGVTVGRQRFSPPQALPPLVSFNRMSPQFNPTSTQAGTGTGTGFTTAGSLPLTDFNSRLYPGSVRQAMRAASLNRLSPPSSGSGLQSEAMLHHNTRFGGAPFDDFAVGVGSRRSGSFDARSVSSLRSGSLASQSTSSLGRYPSRGGSLDWPSGASTSLFAETPLTPTTTASPTATTTPKAEVVEAQSYDYLGIQSQNLSTSPSLVSASSPASSALGHSPATSESLHHEPDTRPTTASSISAAGGIIYTITPSSECPSPHSPEVSSPVGLGVLPTISPFATTLEDLYDFDFPEARKPLPESPVEVLSPVTVVLDVQPASGDDENDKIEESEIHILPEAPIVPLLVPVNPTFNSSLNPTLSISPSLSTASSSYMTSPQEPSDDTPTANTTFTASSKSPGGYDDSPRVETAVPPSIASPINRVQAVSLSATRSNRSTTSTSVGLHPNPLHCRVCLAETCDDITASMCGHIFCNRCITDAVIKTNRCPVCMTPTLLYCLFRLDLAA